MNHREFAKILGVDPSTVLNWENGRHRPDIKKVHRISGLAQPRLLDLLPKAIELVRSSILTWFLPHASSRHPIFGYALIFLALPFRPGMAGSFASGSPEVRKVHHARRMSTTTAIGGGLSLLINFSSII